MFAKPGAAHMYLFLFVNYRGGHKLKAAIEDLAQNPSARAIVCHVTDNSGELEDEQFDHLHGSFAGFSLLKPGKNLGYLQGADFGYQACSGLDTVKWVAVSNYDMRGLDTVELDQLSRYESDPALGCIAPNIISEERRFGRRYRLPLNPHITDRPSLKRITFQNRMLSHYRLFWLYERLWQIKKFFFGAIVEKRASEIEQKVYGAHGSAFFLAAAFFRKGGSLAYPCHLFHEELYVAEQCRELGLTMTYCPSINLVHEANFATSRVPTREKWKAMSAAHAWVKKTYYDRPGAG